jgi:hypothetical protein
MDHTADAGIHRPSVQAEKFYKTPVTDFSFFFAALKVTPFLSARVRPIAAITTQITGML